MTPINRDHVSWNKILTVAGIFLVPSISVLIMCVTWTQKVSDKMDSVVSSIIEIKADLKDVRTDLNNVHIQVDTIRQDQKINKAVNDIRYKNDHFRK